MLPQSRYARIERERRFLLNRFPDKADVVRICHITDRYLDGTSLRLRKQVESNGLMTFKLTQKIPEPGPGSQQGFVTNIFLGENEFSVLAQLPSERIIKTRYSAPPFGIDIFEGELEGLVLAEAEFNSTLDADALRIPPFAIREVSTDSRFTGGRLVLASRREIQEWLREYGIHV